MEHPAGYMDGRLGLDEDQDSSASSDEGKRDFSDPDDDQDGSGEGLGKRQLSLDGSSSQGDSKRHRSRFELQQLEYLSQFYDKQPLVCAWSFGALSILLHKLSKSVPCRTIKSAHTDLCACETDCDIRSFTLNDRCM